MDHHTLGQVRFVETLAMHAWPAAEMTLLDGWRLRFSQGVTRRANSVWPNQADGELALDDKLATVERFYAGHGLPARYQICPAQQPTDLDAILAGRGYRADASTQVQLASVDGVLAKADRRTPPSGWTLTVGERFDADWFATYREAEGFDDHAAAMRQAIIQRIAAPAGFALLHVDGAPVALGLGVLEAGHLGVFSMATRPDFRRQGAATFVLAGLAHWAQVRGAEQIYLQVMDRNTGARALYAGLGFQTLYGYHYRERVVTG